VRGFILISAIAMGGVALGQAPPAAPPVPELSRSTQMQLERLAEEFQKIQIDFTAVDESVKKEHPGWHLASTAQGLRVERDQSTTPPAKVEQPKK
jgi:hypothetical protein